LEQSHSGRAVEQAAILAHHWRRAGEPLKAIDYLLQAGDHARQLGASPEAVSFYQEALAEASMLKTPESDAQLASIHDRLGDVYVESLSLHDEGLMHYTHFLQLAESQEDMARGERKVAVIHLLRGELDEAQQYYEQALERLKRLPPLAESSRVRCGLAYLLVYKNQLAEATAHARASLEASTQIDDVRGQADAHNALGIVASYQGVLKQASKHFEQALGLYRQIGDLPRLAKSCNNVGDCYRRLGHMARALEHLREGVEVAHRIGDTRDESLLLQTQAELLFDQGRWEDGIASLDAALALAEQSGVAERIIEVHTSLGLAHESLGQLAAARHHLDTADRLNEQMEHQQLRPRIYLGLARVSAAEGNMEQAARLVRLAEECAGSDASSALQAELHSTQAVLCEKNAEWDAAAAHLEKSLELVKEGNLQAEVAKTQLHLGGVLARRSAEGDKGRARDLLL
jgi:tetratricopeptide (TPR) repeat protein